MSLTPGQIIDNKYRIVRLIGEGGMGSVYEGENTLIARRVAIKVMHAAATQNEQALLRFEREAQAAGRIGSDHILEVLDLGRLENGDRYMVMEYLDGEPLSQRIERLGRLSPEQIAKLMCQALKGLQAAHNAGIIHRDLKPDNIFILREKAGRPDFVKIIDFGISKFSALGSDMNMTRTGAVMGTPYYMSPEQAKGSSQVDPRSDVYAIGVIMYEAVTGRVPFDGNTFNELMFKIVLSEPPKLTEVVPDLDPRFVAIVNRAMARELDDRFASAAVLMQALDGYLWGATSVYGADAGRAPAPGSVAGVGSVDTAANWANTSADVTVPKKSAAPMIAALALGGVLLGGALLAAFHWMGSTNEADAAAEVDSTGKKTAAETKDSTTSEAPAVAREPVTAKPEGARAVAPSTAPVETATPESTSDSQPAASAAAAPKRAPIAKATAAKPKATPKPAATPKPDTKTPSKPKSTPTDFGY